MGQLGVVLMRRCVVDCEDTFHEIYQNKKIMRFMSQPFQKKLMSSSHRTAIPSQISRHDISTESFRIHRLINVFCSSWSFSDESVADPGFSRGWGANSKRSYYLAIFPHKLHEIERIWTPSEGTCPWFPSPLRSANVSR